MDVGVINDMKKETPAVIGNTFAFLFDLTAYFSCFVRMLARNIRQIWENC